MGGIREWGVWGRQSLLPAVKAENMRCLLPPVLAPRTGDRPETWWSESLSPLELGDVELKWRLGAGESPSEAGSSGLGAHVQSLGPRKEPDLGEVCDRDVASPPTMMLSVVPIVHFCFVSLCAFSKSCFPALWAVLWVPRIFKTMVSSSTQLGFLLFLEQRRHTPPFTLAFTLPFLLPEGSRLHPTHPSV